MRGWCVWIIGCVCCAVPALGATHDVQLPLREGKLGVGQFTATICREMHLPQYHPSGQLDLTAARGPEFVTAINTAFGDGCRARIEKDVLILHVDPDRLPSGCSAMKRSIRLLTAAISPAAVAAQAKNWGLLLPEHLDSQRPLVILLHGLDGDRGDCMPMGAQLAAAGFQVALFGYPGDQPIADSARLLTHHLWALHDRVPRMPIVIVGYSMGGLVARQYVEGPDYAGGVDRLILVGTPNHGSSWARFRMLLAAQEDFHQYRTNPDWRISWVITEGLGEAGDDLMPKSDFLKRLNARPRRAGVQYTIVAGSKSAIDLYESSCIERVDGWIPNRIRSWWGVRHLDASLRGKACHLRDQTGDCDGPVALHSAELSGVSDFVVVPTDHAGLVFPQDGHEPWALKVICDRLAR